jgi:hypothetical protein
VPRDLGPPERVLSTRHAAAPLEHDAQQHRAIRIVQLVGFPVGPLSAGEIPCPFALLTARNEVLCRHLPPPDCKVVKL